MLAITACPPPQSMRTRLLKGFSSIPFQGRFAKDMISFERIARLIEDNGGQMAELDDPKLTHVVLDKRDDSRRRELMKRASKYGHMHFFFSFLCAPLTRICRPKHRNIVLSDFVEACLDENTLLNEAGIVHCLYHCLYQAQFSQDFMP